MLCDRLTQRGYPKRVVRKALKRAWYNPREILLEKRERLPLERTVCVMTFNPNTNRVVSIIKRYWHLIQHLGKLNEPPLFALKKGKNIKDHIVRAASSVKSTNNTIRGIRNSFTGTF